MQFDVLILLVFGVVLSVYFMSHLICLFLVFSFRQLPSSWEPDSGHVPNHVSGTERWRG